MSANTNLETRTKKNPGMADNLYTSLSYRKKKNSLMHVLLIVLTFIAVAPLVSIVGFIMYKGIGVINWEFLTSLPKPATMKGGGIGHAIQGTMMLVGIASAVGIPVGVFTAIYLSEYGIKGPFSSAVRFVTDVLLGVPSIVVGIFAFVAIVRPMGGFSALAGGIALGVIMIPIVARATEEILRLVPNSIREAALALGVPKWRTIISIVLPHAMKGIVTGIMLGVARCAGETAPLIMTAFGNVFWNSDILKPTASLPIQIYSYATSPFPNWIEKAWGGAFVLIVMVLSLNILARILTRGRFKNVT